MKKKNENIVKSRDKDVQSRINKLLGRKVLKLGSCNNEGSKLFKDNKFNIIRGSYNL